MKLMNSVASDVLVEDNQYTEQYTKQQRDVIKEYYKKVMMFLLFLIINIRTVKWNY